MNAAGTIALPEAFSERQRTALLKLLADEDPAVYRTVRQKILSHGPQAAVWLRPCHLCSDPLLRRRALEIVQHFDRQAADDRLLAFCLKNGEGFNLEEGAWLLAQTQYPDISLEGYGALLDSYAAVLGQRLAGSVEAKKVLCTINEFLFDELGFGGNEENYYDPDNSYINRVIDRRTGNPINLCLVYMLLARRLRLPVAGIGLPGHFLCRYQTSAAEIYIDTFNRGKLLAKADCVQYLLQGNYSVRDDYLAPVSPRRMLLRICGNLHRIYLHLQQPQQATRLQRYVVALAK
jgi:regulator of sirC expression with transglutaminase-like and TPR domain